MTSVVRRSLEFPRSHHRFDPFTAFRLTDLSPLERTLVLRAFGVEGQLEHRDFLKAYGFAEQGNGSVVSGERFTGWKTVELFNWAYANWLSDTPDSSPLADRFAMARLRYARKEAALTDGDFAVIIEGVRTKIRETLADWISRKLKQRRFAWATDRNIADDGWVKPQDSVDLALLDCSDREQEIVRLRYGMDHLTFKTQREVGAAFNLTASRIGQIETRVLRKMRYPYGTLLKEFLL